MGSVASLLVWRYLYRHPELCATVMSEGVYRSARFRTLMLSAVSILAVIIALILPGAGNMAFMIMMLARPLAERIEARYPTVPEDDKALP